MTVARPRIKLRVQCEAMVVTERLLGRCVISHCN